MAKEIIFAIIVLPERAICFRLAKSAWDIEKVQGEQWVNWPAASDTTDGMPFLLEQLSKQLHFKNKLASAEIHLLYKKDAVNLLATAPKALHDLGCEQWQIVRLEPMIQRAGDLIGDDKLLEDINFLQHKVLTVLESTLGYRDESTEAKRAHAVHAQEECLAFLHKDILLLKQEKTIMQANLEALKPPSIEYLVSFMPMFYRNFWTVIRPDELALLCGELQAPDIPSPYPEPTPNTILMKKHLFSKLPSTERIKITSFCRAMPHHLELRPEMREFLPDMP